jgi:alpha-galactosidase
MNETLESPLPFSFLYGGMPSSCILPGWPEESATTVRDGVQVLTTIRRDPAAGLEIAMERLTFADSPAVEWVLRLTNRGTRDTPILSEIYPLDMTFRAEKPAIRRPSTWNTEAPLADFLVHSLRGGMAGPEDYQPSERALGEHGAQELLLSGAGGRSSNKEMPFFNVQTGGDEGVIVAVGWSGQWHARFNVTAPHTLRLRAGMEKTNLHLKPGESIRTPRIAVMSWRGDRGDGHNLWRRFLWTHHTLPLAGAKPEPATWADTWFTFNQGYEVNEQNQKDSMTGAARMGIEYLVMDAGWYECPPQRWHAGVGSWVPRPDTFPSGFQPVADHGAACGIAMGIWFEPERATYISRLAREHPEWMLWSPLKGSFLVNLGLPEVRQWLVALVDQYVAQGMRWFRHDFNIDPLESWQRNDTGDRAGMTEIRYVEGLYDVYDEIHRRHPGLVIEGCASGGRRIDLETISRNHGYWATDMMCGTPEPMQAHIWGFNLYLHPHLHNTVLRARNAPKSDTPANRYAFFSFLGGAPCACFDTRDAALDYDLGRRWFDLFKRLRGLTLGDFHPLTEYSLSETVWMGYQFHRSDLDRGLMVVFRRPRCPYPTAVLALRGLTPEAEYTLTDEFTGRQWKRKGADLMTAWEMNLPNQPDIALFTYAR